MEADAHAKFRDQEDILLVVRVLDLDQLVVFPQIDGQKAGLLHIGVFLDRGLFHQSVPGGHEEIFAFAVVPDGNDGCDLFSRLQGQKIDDRRAPGGPAGLRNLVSLQAVHLSGIRKEQKIMMRRSHHQILDVVVADGLHSLDALAAPVLAAEIIRRHPLDVAQIRHGDDHIFLRNQILHGNVKLVIADVGPALVAVFIGDHLDLFLDDAQELLFIRQDAL